MTAKEKAKELVDSFMNLKPPKLSDYSQIYLPTAKLCALIAVDQIEKALTDYGRGDSFQLQNMDSEFRFWEQVKKEIEKL